MGGSGQVYVLDMGQPVKILDLARQMIELSGRTEDEIKIEFVGSRAGEKMHEELWNDGEAVGPTSHPKIMRAARPPIDAVWLEDELDRARAARRRERHARRDRAAPADGRGAAAPRHRRGARRHAALNDPDRHRYRICAARAVTLPAGAAGRVAAVDVLDGLNAEQRRAAEAVRGPVCILAGAGSGKTTTITRRIAHQVATGTFAPVRDPRGHLHRQGRRR